MLSKYRFNQLLAWVVLAIFFGCYFWIFNHPKLSWLDALSVFGVLVVCHHYLLNLVHIASHRAISKNLKVNDFYGNICAIFGGLTLPVFRTTHNLHHANPGDPKKDPDHIISTRGQLWWISVRIFFHDYTFFKRKLYKPKGYLQTYFISRIAQTLIVLTFFINKNLHIWIIFWLFPTLFVGTMYGQFQFYFPHYTTQSIDRWKQSLNLNIFQKFCLFWINFSVYYHYKHHQAINSNQQYFPFWCYVNDKFFNNSMTSPNLSELVKQISY